MTQFNVTSDDYRILAKQVKSSCDSKMQIELDKNGCILYIIIQHLEEWHKEIGTSFQGVDEEIGVCDQSEYVITETECQNEVYDIIPHNFSNTELYKLIN